MTRVVLYVLLGPLFLINTSCSLQSLGLRFADTLIQRELDKHFDFSSAQQGKVDLLVDQSLADLKADFLPQLVLRLRTFSDELKSAEVLKDPSFFKMKISETRVFLFSSTGSIKKILPEFSQVLTPANWLHFEKRYTNRTEELKGQKPQSRLARNIGFFVGKMNSEQTQMLEAWGEANPFPPEIRIENRQFGFEKFKAEMGAFSSAQFQKAAELWLQDSSQFQTAKAQQFYVSRGDKLAELFAELFSSLTPAQKAELETQLLTLAGNLEEFVQRK